MGVLPMAVFGLEVPAGGVPVAANGDFPAAVSFCERHLPAMYVLTSLLVPSYHGRH